MVPYHRPLSPEEQRRLGVAEPAPVARADRVHHDEIDALMHVNNGSYVTWFERLRIRFMEHYDIGTIGKAGDPRIVIRSGHIHWIEEMLRDEDYVVTTRCTGLRNTSLTLEQAVWSAGRKRATFDCVMVLLQPDGHAKMSVPDAIRRRLVDDGARQE